MKNNSIILILLLAFSPASHATNSDAGQYVTSFYKWYIKEAAELKNPLVQPELKKYVTDESYKQLMKAYKADEIDVDYFIKVQDFDDQDWLKNIAADKVITDPVCTQVYMTFGKINPKHVVDCLVKEGNTWKIKSVTDIE